MRTFLIGLVAALIGIAAAGCTNNGASQTDPSVDIRSALRTVVPTDTAVDSLYEQRQYRPAWVEARAAPERLRSAVELLCGSADHGLNRADYVTADLEQTMQRAYAAEHPSDSIRALRLAELDVAISKRLIEVADDLITGRVNPNDFGDAWRAPVHSISPVGIVSEAAAQSDPSIIAEHATDAHEQYALLLDALDKYRTVQREGGFPRVESGPLLSKEDSSRRVRQVKERLVASGDLDRSALADTSYQYTSRTAEAVRAFQERHGLKIDGVAGESVIGAMNVPVKERIRQIELNLERWRWIPTNLGGRYLYVNIPAFQLRAFENGEEVLQSNVVVGKQYDARATPVFSDTMEYVVFNPYWNIPQSIATDEILPQARQNPSHLSANDYEIVTGWGQGAEVVSATARNMDLLASGDYRLRQEPGPQNALGRIKFMFPNRFDIYLHDTPADHLFERRDRAFSHGCIRVEKEIALGEYALTGWTEQQIEQTIASRNHQTEYLENPVPVYILYWTSFVDDQGRVHFRDDLYGHDEALRSALAAQAPDASAASCTALTSSLEPNES